jgi:hypothetical protein
MEMIDIAGGILLALFALVALWLVVSVSVAVLMWTVAFFYLCWEDWKTAREHVRTKWKNGDKEQTKS